jgi:hypothetical protein
MKKILLFLIFIPYIVNAQNFSISKKEAYFDTTDTRLLNVRSKIYINPSEMTTADSCLTIDNGLIKRSALVSLSEVTANIINTDTLIMGGDTIINIAVLLVDDGYLDLPTGRTIIGSVFVKGSAERCNFYVITDGTVTRDFYNDFVATDTDTKACVFDAGAYAKIKNRLGAPKTFIISYAY